MDSMKFSFHICLTCLASQQVIMCDCKFRCDRLRNDFLQGIQFLNTGLNMLLVLVATSFCSNKRQHLAKVMGFQFLRICRGKNSNYVTTFWLYDLQ